MERKLRIVDAWDRHDLLLDSRHHASSHATTNVDDSISGAVPQEVHEGARILKSSNLISFGAYEIWCLVLYIKPGSRLNQPLHYSWLKDSGTPPAAFNTHSAVVAKPPIPSLNVHAAGERE